ncbi:ABC transporter permease [Bombilactobacillus bombi]|uniref:ABC transporter permease n=1 Tax=Bombilactobacillus bombi TaxID=1303590 RepID=UPI0015E5B523|nr:ABC transporter permease [Bombilactobacillus bombi]
MHNFRLWTQINFKRLIGRNLRSFIFCILVPAAFYLLFTKVMNQGMPRDFKQTYLISMVIYATLLSSVITVSNNTLADREQHVWRLLKVTPLNISTYYGSLFLNILLLSVIEVAAMELIAFLVVGVELTLSNWGLIILLATLGSLPLMLFGASITYLGDGNTVNLVSSMLVFPVAVLSGLWWPLSMFPHWLQKIGQLLPTYQTYDLINRVIQKHSWPLTSILGEIIWLIIGIIMILFVQKHSHAV